MTAMFAICTEKVQIIVLLPRPGQQLGPNPACRTRPD
jgi:hypothetical protein